MKNISLLFFLIIFCLSSNSIALNIEDNCKVKIGSFDWDSSLIHSQIIKKIIEYGYNCKGEILEIDRKLKKIKIKSINMIKKHLKPTKENKGGIISKENFIHQSNVKNIDIKKTEKKAGGKK